MSVGIVQSSPQAPHRYEVDDLVRGRKSTSDEEESLPSLPQLQGSRNGNVPVARVSAPDAASAVSDDLYHPISAPKRPSKSMLRHADDGIARPTASRTHNGPPSTSSGYDATVHQGYPPSTLQYSYPPQRARHQPDAATERPRDLRRDAANDIVNEILPPGFLDAQWQDRGYREQSGSEYYEELLEEKLGLIGKTSATKRRPPPSSVDRYPPREDDGAFRRHHGTRVRRNDTAFNVDGEVETLLRSVEALQTSGVGEKGRYTMGVVNENMFVDTLVNDPNADVDALLSNVLVKPARSQQPAPQVRDEPKPVAREFTAKNDSAAVHFTSVDRDQPRAPSESSRALTELQSAIHAAELKHSEQAAHAGTPKSPVQNTLDQPNLYPSLQSHPSHLPEIHEVHQLHHPPTMHPPLPPHVVATPHGVVVAMTHHIQPLLAHYAQPEEFTGDLAALHNSIQRAHAKTGSVNSSQLVSAADELNAHIFNVETNAKQRHAEHLRWLAVRHVEEWEKVENKERDRIAFEEGNRWNDLWREHSMRLGDAMAVSLRPRWLRFDSPSVASIAWERGPEGPGVEGAPNAIRRPFAHDHHQHPFPLPLDPSPILIPTPLHPPPFQSPPSHSPIQDPFPSMPPEIVARASVATGLPPHFTNDPSAKPRWKRVEEVLPDGTCLVKWHREAEGPVDGNVSPFSSPFRRSTRKTSPQRERSVHPVVEIPSPLMRAACSPIRTPAFPAFA
ncbi:hypothetical protein DIPPA_53001 [Diplonema papillatum]|nr:hypothetical protein DIPPA_53001 [Diplonema papillatum]